MSHSMVPAVFLLENVVFGCFLIINLFFKLSGYKKKSTWVLNMLSEV